MTGSVNRRRLLQLGVLATGAAACRLAPLTVWADPPATRPAKGLRIHRVYALGPVPNWPKPEFDAQAEVRRFENHLEHVARQFDDVQLVGGQLVRTRQEAANVATELSGADAVLAFHLSMNTAPMLETIVNAGRPTVVFSQPFSGHEWMDMCRWQKEGKKLVILATSDWSELNRAVRLLRVPGRLARSRILLGGVERITPLAAGQPHPWLWTTGSEIGLGLAEIRQRLGVEVIRLSAQQLVQAHEAIAPELAEQEAEQCWIRPARAIVEPSRQEIVKSARMYLAMKKLLADHQAQAISIHCLGGIPIDSIGYPCLGFSRLCDEGIPGACEADLDSTLTMLMFQYAFGVPGFITDPVFDLSRNAVIHAHCVSPTRMDGPAGARAPFLIRSHREDNRGASLEVELRVGQVITCAKLIHIDTLLISTGRIIEIPDFDDRGCRTQIVTEVADARRMMENFTGGLHRVVFYGDHLRDARDLARLMGFTVVQET